MKILIYDPFAGISGDMNIGAMVSLGVPESYFRETIKQLHLPGAAVEFIRDVRKGISGIRALVHDHDVEENSRGGPSDHGNAHSHSHLPDRNLDDIKKIISESSLETVIKERSIAIFTCLAEAEALVHGKGIEEVHFHETGAIDSIIDIVCSAAAIEYIKPDRIISKPVELGGGFIKCAHGILPVPAPATAALLENIPVTAGRVNHEATTPTGAAIIRTLADEFSACYSCRIIKTGYGIGSRDVEIPNVLRVMLAETSDTVLPVSDINSSESCDTDAVMINCNIDDMNPEFYSHIMDKLFASGAKEVYLTPVYMKKNRPGTLLTVMTSQFLENDMKDIIFLETTTAGIRSHIVRQNMLERREELHESRFGMIRIKKLFRNGQCISVKPEYDDMARLAGENGVPVKDLYKEIKL